MKNRFFQIRIITGLIFLIAASAIVLLFNFASSTLADRNEYSVDFEEFSKLMEMHHNGELVYLNSKINGDRISGFQSWRSDSRRQVNIIDFYLPKISRTSFFSKFESVRKFYENGIKKESFDSQFYDCCAHRIEFRTNNGIPSGTQLLYVEAIKDMKHLPKKKKSENDKYYIWLKNGWSGESTSKDAPELYRKWNDYKTLMEQYN